MLLRYRMNRLIRLLERKDTDRFNALIRSEKYRKALKALDDQGCVQVLKAWGGDTPLVLLENHYATYQLSRQDIWKNRFWSFLSGVAITLAAQFFISVLGL